MPAPRHHETQWVNGKRIASLEYHSWQMMRNRCNNPRAMDYRYYGGAGITIDPSWDRFEQFLGDMGRRPSPTHTLERKDGTLGYSKHNCEWATRTQQSRNRAYVKVSRQIAAEIRAATGRQVDIARKFGLSQARVSQIKRGMGWEVEHV